LKKKRRKRFGDYVRQFEIVGLVEERSWEKNRKVEYKWECYAAKRGKKKRREAEWNFGNFWN
jgi:hypothetical protein